MTSDPALQRLLVLLLGAVAIWAAAFAPSLSSPWRERILFVAALTGAILSAWLLVLVGQLLVGRWRTLRHRLAVALETRHDTRIRAFPSQGRVEGGKFDGEPSVLICLILAPGEVPTEGVRCELHRGRSIRRSNELVPTGDGFVTFFPQSFGLSLHGEYWFRFSWSVNGKVIATTRLHLAEDLTYRETLIA